MRAPAFKLLFFILLPCAIAAQSDSTSKTKITYQLKKDDSTRAGKTESFPFANSLAPVQNTDSIKAFKREIDSLAPLLFRKGKAKIYLDTLASWNLVYYEFFGGQQIKNEPKIGSDSKYKCRNKENIFSGAEIVKMLSIDKKYTRKTPFRRLKKYPVIYKRGHRFNRVPMPILFKGDYLVVRIVHSYPYGNVTSWYHERIYYFRKVK